MANNSVSSSTDLLSLDFFANKESLKNFLKGQAIFKDYDFDGSNINVLLDLLGVNTFKHAFYHNMVFSESHLDSAQLRSSIASHAKSLNYLPRSKKSAKASVRVSFTATGDSAPYILPKGSPFTTLVKNQSYTFTLPETITVSSSNTNFSFETDIYEGIYVKDAYVVSSIQDNQRYKLTNVNVDTDSITVVVYEDGSDTGETYKFTDSIIELTNTSKVFFLQPTGDGYYEILFGDDIFGKRPKLLSSIVIDYRITLGPSPNGARIFSLDFEPTNNNELLSTPVVETVESATGGADEQTNESIKIYAPRYYAAQKRAVSSDDYAALVLSKFTRNVDDAVSYGGELLNPKRYGRVALALKPTTGEVVPDFTKNEIIKYLKDRAVGGRVIIVDPDYYYCEIKTTVQYNTAITAKTQNEIKGIVENAIETYSSTNMEQFDSDFRYSKFVRNIDDSHESITSNDTRVRIIKRLVPKIHAFETYQIEFDNEIEAGQEGMVDSSPFTWVDEEDNDHPLSYISDDGEGNLFIYKFVNNNKLVLKNSIGTVDYISGTVNINKLMVNAYSNYISIYVTPVNKDIIINKKKILKIEIDDVEVDVIGTLF